MNHTPGAAPAMAPDVRSRAMFAIGLAVFVAGVGNSFVFAVLPPAGRELGLSDVQIGSIITLSAFIFMIAAPLWGAKSEHWGRRRVILFGQSAYGITTLLFAITIQLGLVGAIPALTAFIGLLFFRALFTGCIAGIFPASQAYLADVTTLQERTRAMTVIGVSVGLGMVTGPALAAIFSSVSLVFPFYAVAGLSVIAGAVTFRNMPEPEKHRTKFDAEAVNGGLMTFAPYLIASVIMMCVLAAVQQASGFYFQDKFNLDAQTTAQRVGWALMASAMANVVSQMVIVRRLGWTSKRLLRTGAPVALAALILLILADHYAVLVLGMALYGLGHGMIMPGSVAALSLAAGSHEQGSAAGLNTSAQGFGFMLGPMIGSVFYTRHELLPYAVCIALLAALCIHVWWIIPFRAAEEDK